jgi:hypothetical protein
VRYGESIDAQLMSKNVATQLCPAQKRAFEALAAVLHAGFIFRVWGGVGRGKTSILNELHKQVGGAFFNTEPPNHASH